MKCNRIYAKRTYFAIICINLGSTAPYDSKIVDLQNKSKIVQKLPEISNSVSRLKINNPSLVKSYSNLLYDRK